MTGCLPDPINRTAKDSFGIDYLFPYQRPVISNILERRDQIVICAYSPGTTHVTPSSRFEVA